MKSGGKSLYRQQPKEDDLQRPHSVRNLVIGTGVLGAITLICWYGTGASNTGTSSSGFIACSEANCPAPTTLPMESRAPAQANANGSSGGNPKVIGGSTKRPGTVTGLSPIIAALVNPTTTTTGTTVGPVVHPSTAASGTTPTTVKPTTVAPTTVKPTTVAPTTVAPTTVAPTTVAPTTVAPTTVAPTTVAPTTVAPTTVDPTTSADPVPSVTATPTSADPVTS
jgi:hypothetical protein